MQEMGNTFVAGKFDAFRIHHKKTHLFRGCIIEDGSDNRIDTNALSRTGCTGNQQVGHLRQISHRQITNHIKPKGNRKLVGISPIGLGGDQFTNINNLPNFVGDFYSQCSLAGNGSNNPDRLCFQTKCKIVC